MNRIYRFDPGKFNTHWLLLNEISEKSRVLEIGTASGYLGEYLVKEKGSEVWGVEPVKELYEDAQNYGYTKLFNIAVEDLFALPEIKNEQFDVILLGDVLEHMVDPGKVLYGLRQFLKPSGRFVISLPNIAHYSTRLKLLTGNWDYTDGGIMDKTHLRFFTLKTVRDLLENNGLKIEKVRPSNGQLERFGINKLFGIGKKVFFLWPTLFAIQFVLVATKKE